MGVGIALAKAGRERRSTGQRRRERPLGLEPDERLAFGLRRMALGQVDLALELLAHADTSAPDEHAVHETRKALKRLRALVRLLEGELGAKALARENAALRETARHLAGARDAAVMLGTLDQLLERHPRKLERRKGVIELRRRLLAERALMEQQTLRDPAVLAQVLGELCAFRERVAAWSLPDRDGIELLEPGLAKLYRQGRRRYRRVARGKADLVLAMHEWRKRVKDLRYAAEMLERHYPSEGAGAPGRKRRGKRPARKRAKRRRDAACVRRVARRADELGEVLGEDHDLAVLAQAIRARGKRGGAVTGRIPRGTRKTLLKLIARRRRELHARALREGERLYERSPRRFIAGIRAAYASGERQLS
ncbi:MAG TPA: CHAD domain-containing protein [Solirubrobacteraceae bacterium]|nr:CHAD domain-containing protein [Solirubrobacteraceae bacterium]